MDKIPNKVYLADYTPAPFTIDRTDLVFELADHQTKVTSTLKMRRIVKDITSLTLQGEKMELQSI
ncbi:MAG: hypothetical protein HN730_11165, partial [Bdellovibrionales bacterium]|nr:hypothetical protein [Bdellovibrionales bacterium]